MANAVLAAVTVPAN